MKLHKAIGIRLSLLPVFGYRASGRFEALTPVTSTGLTVEDLPFPKEYRLGSGQYNDVSLSDYVRDEFGWPLILRCIKRLQSRSKYTTDSRQTQIYEDKDGKSLFFSECHRTRRISVFHEDEIDMELAMNAELASESGQS